MSENESRFFAIDFDRCLSNTDALFEVFYATVDEHAELDREELVRERRAIEDKGGSFDQISALRTLLGESDVKEFIDTFVKRALSHDLLSEGSRALLGRLIERNIPHGIVSYGNSDWQQIKIQASGVGDVPRLITPHSRKAEIVNSWWDDRGGFLVPRELSDSGVHVETVILLDDKAVAFNGLSEYAKGYWIKSPHATLLPSQVGTVPSNVVEVFGLSEVIKRESL